MSFMIYVLRIDDAKEANSGDDLLSSSPPCPFLRVSGCESPRRPDTAMETRKGLAVAIQRYVIQNSPYSQSTSRGAVKLAATSATAAFEARKPTDHPPADGAAARAVVLLVVAPPLLDDDRLVL